MIAWLKLCIDLCSGLGGFSQAFKESPEWEVVTVDIERKFKPTVCADVRYLPFRQDVRPDLVLMSPPCQRFSLARNEFPKKGIRLGLDIVGACLEFVAASKPKHWIMENPKGRLRWFVGKPKTTINQSDYGFPCKKPTDLWGNIQLPMIYRQREYARATRGRKAFAEKFPRHDKFIAFNQFFSGSQSAERAKIPYELSLAVMQAVKETRQD